MINEWRFIRGAAQLRGLRVWGVCVCAHDCGVWQECRIAWWISVQIYLSIHIQSMLHIRFSSHYQIRGHFILCVVYLYFLIELICIHKLLVSWKGLWNLVLIIRKITVALRTQRTATYRNTCKDTKHKQMKKMSSSNWQHAAFGKQCYKVRKQPNTQTVSHTEHGN